MTIERELTDAEAEALQEALQASSNFALAVERLQTAFQAVLAYNLRERERLERLYADTKFRLDGLDK